MLGSRSLATELTEEQLAEYYSNKVPKPTSASELLNLMSKGGGLDRKWENPLYAAKLNGIDHSTIESWVRELTSQGKITKIRSTGVTELDDKWFTTYMAEIHGTLGRISEAGGKDMEDLRDLYTKGLSYEVATEFDGVKPTTWEKRIITDAHEALRVKIIEMLGSEGPARGEEIIERLPFPQGQIDSILHELEMRNLSLSDFKQTKTQNIFSKLMNTKSQVERRMLSSIDGSKISLCRNHLSNTLMDLQRSTSIYYSKSNKKCCIALMDSDMQIGKICS